MQSLYQNEWARQCDWESTSALFVEPPCTDPKFQQGPLLAKIQVSTAADHWGAHQRTARTVLHEISATFHVLAMPTKATDTFDAEAATLGATMLGLAGEPLKQALRQAGVLYDVFVPGASEACSNCTSLKAVKRQFEDISYVLLRAPECEPWPQFKEPLCTCRLFSQYGGCPHCEFAKTQDLPLRRKDVDLTELPAQKKKGRKPGKCLTQRGAAKAKAKAEQKSRSAKVKKDTGKVKGKAT